MPALSNVSYPPIRVSGPRSEEYWQIHLRHAQDQLVEIRKRLENSPLPEHPRRTFFSPGRTFVTRAYVRAVHHWEEHQRERIRLRRRACMLEQTKIPFYYERIRSFRPMLWEHLLRDDLAQG